VKSDYTLGALCFQFLYTWLAYP